MAKTALKPETRSLTFLHPAEETLVKLKRKGLGFVVEKVTMAGGVVVSREEVRDWNDRGTTERILIKVATEALRLEDVEREKAVKK